MKSRKIKFTSLAFLGMLLMTVNSFAQFTTTEEAKDFINDRLSHSVLQKIDPDGTVTISTPGEKIKFNLRNAAFNYNDGNSDSLVRVTTDNGIEHYDHKILVEKTSRQSFLCESESEAKTVITAFKFLKKKFGVDQKTTQAGSKILKTGDSTITVKTVDEAIDFINENLSYSVITGIDEKGMMTINSPEEDYQVNLFQAEFGYNDAEDGSKVRIYGDFCIGLKKHGKDPELITRKSFQTSNRVKAYKVITVLYYLKSTYANIDPNNIPQLKNLCAVRISSYTDPVEAINFINARLAYSIILGIDHNGVLTINAPEEVYRFNVNEVKLSRALNQKVRSDWFSFIHVDGPANSVLVECRSCISKYNAPGSPDTLDEQTFQARSGHSDGLRSGRLRGFPVLPFH